MSKMKNYVDNHRFILIVLLIAALIRIINIQISLYEPANAQTRQALTAMTAKNFYMNGFDFLRPQLDNNGNDCDLYLVGAPIDAFIFSLGYGLFQPPTVWMRLVSVIFSLATILILYHLILLFFDRRTAIVASMLFAFSPMSVALARSIQPESIMVFAIVTCVYCFVKYCAEEKKVYLIISSLCLIAGISMKVYTLYLLLPLSYLLIMKYGKTFYKKLPFWIGILSVIIAMSWYVYAFILSQHNVLLYQIFGANKELYDFISNIATKTFAKSISKTFLYILSPCGVILVFFGLIIKGSKGKTWLFHTWLIGLVGYLIVFSGPNMNHPYYLFPFLPVLSLFFARGFFYLENVKIFQNTYLNNKIAIIALLFFCFFPWTYHYKEIFRIEPSAKFCAEAGIAVDKMVPKNALVIAAYSSGPSFLYYCNRKGWAFQIHQEQLVEAFKRQNAVMPSDYRLDPIWQLEELRKKGAHYFASANMEEFTTRVDFAEYMFANYNVLRVVENGYIIFDITKQKNS